MLAVAAAASAGWLEVYAIHALGGHPVPALAGGGPWHAGFTGFVGLTALGFTTALIGMVAAFACAGIAALWRACGRSGARLLGHYVGD